MTNPPPGADEHRHNPALRRKRQAARPPSQDLHYYPDEHPEIPRVRRASLYPDQAQHRPRKAEDVQEDAAERSTPTLPTPLPQRPVGHPAAREDSIAVVEHKSRRVFTPPPPARRRRPFKRRKRSLRDQPILPGHKRPAIIIAALLVVILLMSGIIVKVTRSQLASQNMPPANSTAPAGVQHSGNPYELVIAPTDTDHPAPPVFATSAYLLDADTGATLYAHNPFMHLPMLSTTKLMTAVLVLEHGNLDTKITISDAINNDLSQLSPDSTVMGIKRGETYTLRDLLYGLLLLSGNDAAIAIADALAGNAANFVAEMNQQAHQLGLLNTHYMNPHGLLATDHYSSAHDLAFLGRYSMRIPMLHAISDTETYVIPKTSAHPEHDLINGNQFLWWYPDVDGGKPGYDGAFCFQVISVTRNHHHLIGVVMHTINWWTDMRNLMNWGFDNFTWISPRDVDSQQHPIPFDYLSNYFASDKQEQTIETAGSRYYIYTGYAISGAVLAYFDQKGGLKHFGYPTSLPIASGTSGFSQHFTQSTIQCDLTTKQCHTQ